MQSVDLTADLGHLLFSCWDLPACHTGILARPLFLAEPSYKAFGKICYEALPGAMKLSPIKFEFGHSLHLQASAWKSPI